MTASTRKLASRPIVRTLALAAGAALALAGGRAAAAEAPKEFKFGMVLALTGPGSWYGVTMSRGAELAAEEINAAGGAAGLKLVPVIEDHRSGDTSAGQAAVRKLIDIDKVSFIEGSYGSVCTSIQPLCAENKVVLVNGGGTAPSLLNKAYLHNTRALGDTTAAAVLKYLKDERGCKKLATIFYNQESGITINREATKLWKSWGGTVVKESMVATGQTDFTGEVSQLRAAKPDCIGIWSYGTDVGYTVKDIRRLGLGVPVAGVEFTPDAFAIAGKAFEGFLTGLDDFDPELNNPQTQKFVKAFRAKYGADAKLDYYCANYYDLTYVLKELIQRVKAKGGNPFDGAQLEAALKANPRFDTVYGGTMELRPDGGVVKPISIFEVKDGKQVRLKRVNGV
jgi:branched-chain amino acid transport system substrate-binding protein